MGDVKWIKFYVSILTNPKIKRIRRMPDGNTVALIWAYLLAQAGESNKDGAVYFTEEIPYSPDEFALQYDFEVDTVRLAVATFEKFGMIGVFDGIIYIKNWEKYQNINGLEKIKEQNRVRQANFRDRKRLEQGNVTNNVIDNDGVTQGHATEEEQEIDIDIDKDYVQKEHMNSVSKKDINDFFEKMWKLYPSKKGKGQISDAKKKALHKIGEEEFKRAIERYKAELKKDDWRKEQNGSTFFNSGHVDYLDANFEPSKEQVKTNSNTNNKFNQFPQREYTAKDYSELEKKLLQRGFEDETNDD